MRVRLDHMNVKGELTGFRDEVEVLIARRGKLRTLSVVLEADPALTWSLSRKSNAESLQTKRFDAWMAR